MKQSIMAALAFSLLATVAHTQDTPIVDVAAGYSFFYVVKGFTLAMNGGSASVAFNANPWLGIVGDFGAYQAAPSSDTGLTGETYAFGPRFSYHKEGRTIPFAQVLIGGGHTSSVAGGFTSENAFAIGGGGGADIGLDGPGKFALRPQLDYFGFRSSGSTTNVVRLSIGIVLRIGNRQSREFR